jgi:CHAT domain-containing protein
VSQLLRGETGIARNTLDQQYRAAAKTRSGGAAVLALALFWLAEVRHFNCFPEGYGAGSIEIDLRWNGVEKAQAYHTLALEARTWPGADAVSLAYRWLQFIAARLSALVTVRDARDYAHKDLILQLHVQQCEMARDDARALSPSALGFVERSIAELFSVAGERSRAEEALVRANEIYRIAQDDAGVASCLALRSDWWVAPASSALVRNLVIADAAFPSSELTWNTEAVEGSAEALDLPQGRAVLEEALRLYERAGSPCGVASVLLRLAHVARLEGQLDTQLARAKEAQERFMDAGDPLHAHLALAHHTLALLDARRFPEDRDAAETIGAWGNGVGSFSYVLGLGILFTRAGRQALLREGDYEKAEGCFQLAFALNNMLAARCRCSQSQADLAVLHQALGNRERSQTHQEDAIDALIVTPSDANSSSLVQQRAALLTQQLFREALDHRDAAGMERAVRRMENLNPQIDGPAGLAVKSFLEETREQAVVLIPLYKAVDERNRGDDGEAEILFDKALEAARRIDSNKLWEAVVQAHRRHYPEAVRAFEAYQQAGAALSGLGGDVLQLIQSVSGLQAQRELQIARRRSTEQSFSFMVRAKAYERAAVHLQELEQLAGTEWWAEDEHPWRSLSDIAEMHEGLGPADKKLIHYQEALRFYEQAIEQLEQRRSLLTRDELKTALAADFGVQYLYFQAVRAAIKLARAANDPDQRRAIQRRAFALSEQGRARALLDLLAANLRRPAGATGESAELGRWRELTSSIQLWRGLLARARSSGKSDERVDALRQKIDAYERELYELERTISRSEPQAAKLLSSTAQVACLDEVAARLPPHTVILQYMTLGEELLVWTVTRQGLNHDNVISLRASVLARLVREFQQGCAMAAPIEIIKQQAAVLSAHLLDPIAPVIDQHDRLIITPYGDLNLLPFSALQWRNDWLGKQRTVSYLPSASMLLLLSQSRSQAEHMTLAVGNPQHMSHRPPFGTDELLPPLKHAETEAQSVAKLYDTKPVIGPEATIEEIRPQLSTHRQLLFATHGVLYEEAPLLSGIALANGYVLTVQELMGLRLDADLITVSACKSGLGTRTGGEEIVGLTRGLLAAGARAVVVTLWPVLDLSTAVLMVRFHQRLKEGADPAIALAQAQSWFSGLSNYGLHQEKAKLRDLGVGEVKPVSPSHPQHWAPFIVIGA